MGSATDTIDSGLPELSDYGVDAAPATPASPAAAVLTAAAAASQGDHPAVTAVLTNEAAKAKGAPPPLPPPVGPQDAAALKQAAQTSRQLGDPPVVTAALATAANTAAASGAQVAQVLTDASQKASSVGAHEAVTAALSNGAAKAMGAAPVAATPKGPEAAVALSTAANASAAKNDHPVVTATLADAAAKASSPTVANVLAQAASGPDSAMHPAAAQMLAKAAVANNPPPLGIVPSYPNLPGAPNPLPLPAGPPAMPVAAYPEGAPPSPPAASPPPPPALAAVPPAQATAIEASTLSTLTPKDGVDLQPGEALEAGHYIPSHRCGRHGGPRHKLVMQHDGNLVLYHDMTPIWATHTGGTGARRAHMRTDGHFVLENERGQVVWASGARTPGSFAVLQDDGNFVQYCGNKALWASHQDARSRGRDLRRIGNIFLGGARHYGHRGGASFGAEGVRDERVFRKLASHMRNAVHPRHQRGLDLALETSTGMYTPEEVQFAVARLNDADRAGYAAGTALKIGLAHPKFGQHMRAHFHGDMGCEDEMGDDMGVEWRPWMWFRSRRIEVRPYQPPPAVIPIAGPGAAPPPPPPQSNGAPPPPPPQGMVDPESPESVFTDTINQGDLSAPLVLPDGQYMPVPVFRTWIERRRWEDDQRRRLSGRYPGLPWNVNPPPPPPGGWAQWRQNQAAVSSGIGTPVVMAPVSPFAPPPPPGVPRTPLYVERAREPSHVFSPEHAFTAPREMAAPHGFHGGDAEAGSEYSVSELLQMDAGSEYSMSEHLQMEGNVDSIRQTAEFLGGFGVDANIQFGGNVGVEGNFQFGVDGAEMGLEQAALDSLEGAALGNQFRAFRGQTGFGLEPAALASLADGDMGQGYRAFPNQTGFGWDWPWRRRRPRPPIAPYAGTGAPPPPPPPGALQPWGHYRGPRQAFAPGADPVSAATDGAALQATGAAAAIGSTVLGHDSQQAALSVIMSHAHLRLGALSTGLGNFFHKILGLFDHVLHPLLEKATIAPDGKGGLVTTLPTTTVTGKAG